METITIDTAPNDNNYPLCESCSADIFPSNTDSTKRFPVKYKKFDILCQTCYNTEKSTYDASKPIMQQSTEVIITKREEFFNAEKTDLALIVGSNFERIIAIRERIDKWKTLLFEIRAREETCQGALNLLASGISADERAKLKISDLTYNPTTTGSPKPKVTRISAADKANNTMVQALFGHAIKSGKMSEVEAIEKVKEITRQAKNSTFTKMASGELVCSCQKTPGICRVHGDSVK